MNEKINFTIKETFASAVQNHKKNKLEAAENLYKEVLKKNPNHFQSICFLGTLLIPVSYTHLTLPTKRIV